MPPVELIPAVDSVSRYNYPHQFGDLQPLVADLERMLLAGAYVLSREVSEFEAAFARYCGCAHARGVNTGTDALILALRALAIGRGDKVIAPANTFHATIAAIELAGAEPVLVDARADTFLLDQDQLPGLFDPSVRAIIPVHLYGKPVPMLNLLALAQRRGIAVIEDAAQAHGAKIHGRPVGSFGKIGCFSFHPSKNLAAAGDAGAVVTNDVALAARIDQLRSLGQAAQNEHVTLGLNSKLDALQARILSWKLPHLDRWNEARARIAAWYRGGLSHLPLTFQATHADELHVFHLFQVRTVHRDALLAHLKAHNIVAVIRYPTPVHLQPAFAHRGWRAGDFPVAERLSRELLCLPIRPDMNESETGYVIHAVCRFFENGARA
jgi:dTDP-4-amino-4,6-dideoxygalactose transaminase